eukprot:scaffold1452_cov117-Isochrysis_galbana.AAC.16
MLETAACACTHARHSARLAMPMLLHIVMRRAERCCRRPCVLALSAELALMLRVAWRQGGIEVGECVRTAPGGRAEDDGDSSSKVRPARASSCMHAAQVVGNGKKQSCATCARAALSS